MRERWQFKKNTSAKICGSKYFQLMLTRRTGRGCMLTGGRQPGILPLNEAYLRRLRSCKAFPKVIRARDADGA